MHLRGEVGRGLFRVKRTLVKPEVTTALGAYSPLLRDCGVPSLPTSYLS
jgi:hypothetical protein